MLLYDKPPVLPGVGVRMGVQVLVLFFLILFCFFLLTAGTQVSLNNPSQCYTVENSSF